MSENPEYEAMQPEDAAIHLDEYRLALGYVTAQEATFGPSRSLTEAEFRDVTQQTLADFEAMHLGVSDLVAALGGLVLMACHHAGRSAGSTTQEVLAALGALING